MTEKDPNHKHPELKKAQTSTRKPDPETLGKTDPQEHMEGPISSLVHKVEKSVGENDQEGSGEKRD